MTNKVLYFDTLQYTNLPLWVLFNNHITVMLQFLNPLIDNGVYLLKFYDLQI